MHLPDNGDELAIQLEDRLLRHPNATTWRRVTTTVIGADGDRVRQVTFRRASADGSVTGLVEDRIIRNMHPLTAQRLDIWRLKNFHGKALPRPPTPTSITLWPRRIQPTSG